MPINKEVLFKTLEYTTSTAGTAFKVWEANSDQYAITTYVKGSNWSCSIDVDSNGRWKINDARGTESNAVKFSHNSKALYISCSSSTSLMSRIEIKYGTINSILPSVTTATSGSLQTIPNGTSISKETVNDLNVTGNTNVSNAFNVQGNTSVSANANLNSNLTVGGNTNVANDLTVTGTTDVGTSTKSANAQLKSDLIVTGNTNVGTSDKSANAQLKSDLIVTGNTTVDNDLIVNGNTTVSLNANLNSNLTVNGNTIVTNSANLNHGLSVNTGLTLVKNSATLNDGLTVTNGLTTVNGSLGANLNNGLTVTESTYVGATASLNGNLTVSQDTSVSANANLNSNLTVGGNTNVSQNLNVSGNTTVSLNANLNSDLIVTGTTDVGTSTKSANAQLKSDLTVTGTTDVGTSTKSANAQLKSDLIVTGNTNVGTSTKSANAQLKSDLIVTGNTTVSLNANLNSNLTVIGNTNVGTSTKSANAQLKSDLIVNGNTTVSLNANLNSNLTVEGNTTVGTSTKSANANLNSDLIVTGNTNVANDLTVTGNTNVGTSTKSANAQLKSDLIVNGNTTVSLNANLNSNLTVEGNTTVGTTTNAANVNLNGTVFITGSTNIKENASFCHGILVEGPATIHGVYDEGDPSKYTAIFNEGLKTDNGLVTGNLNATNLTVSQNVTVPGSLNIGPNSSLNVNQIHTPNNTLTIGTCLPVGDNYAVAVTRKDGEYYYTNTAGQELKIDEETYNNLKDKFTLVIDGNIYTNNIIVNGTEIASGLATNLQKNNSNMNLLYQKGTNETELATGLIYNGDTNAELSTLQIQQPKQTTSNNSIVNNGIVFTAKADNESSIELKYNNNTQLSLKVDNSGNSLIKATCFNGKINNSESADVAIKLNTNDGSTTHPVYFSNGIPVKVSGTISLNTSGYSEYAKKIVTTTTTNNKSYYIPFVSSSVAVSTGTDMYVGGQNVTFNPSTGQLKSSSISTSHANFDNTTITTKLELNGEGASLLVSGSQSNVTFHGSLNVNSTTSLNGNTTIANDLSVTGNTSISKNLTVGGDLIVKGNTTTVNTTELYIADTFLELGKESEGTTIVSTPVGFFTRTSSTNNVVLAISDGYGYIGSQSSSLDQEEIATNNDNRIITEGNISSSHDTITINDEKDLIINNVEQALSLVKLNTTSKAYEKYNVGSSNGGDLIYFSGGRPVQQTGSIGSANQLVYISNGKIVAGNNLPTIPSLSISSSGDGLFITDITNSGHAITITQSTPDEIYKIAATPSISNNTPYRVLIIESSAKDYPKYTEFISYMETDGIPKLSIGNNILTADAITASTFTGNLIGNASTATEAATVKYEQAAVNADRHVWFSDSNNAGKLVIHNSFKYNPSTGILLAPIFSGNLVGNASTASALTTASAGSSTKPVYFSGGIPVETSGTLAVSITGNAATATALTTNAGSSYWPVYFNNGKPNKIELIDYSQRELNTGEHTEHVMLFNDDETKGFGTHSNLRLITTPESQICLELVKKDETTPSCMKADMFNGTASNALLLGGRAESALSVSHATTAGTADVGKKVKTTATSSNSSYYIPFVSSSTSLASTSIYVGNSKAFTFNPSTGVVSAPTFSGALIGNASTAHILVASSNMVGICVGTSSHPIYFLNGNPQPCADTISLNTSGTAAIAQAIFCVGASIENETDTYYSIVASASNSDHSNSNKQLRHAASTLQFSPNGKVQFAGVTRSNRHGMAAPCLTIEANIYDGGENSEIGYAPKGQTIISTYNAQNSDRLYFLTDSAEFSNSLAAQTFTASTSITAQSFNANSDRRLKTNIKKIPQSISATDILNKTNIYTFNYTNNMTETSMGVIAQELEDIDIDGFKIVHKDNSEYLSVKETKFIYLLIQGFKEQSKYIASLEERIKKLEDL